MKRPWTPARKASHAGTWVFGELFPQLVGASPEISSRVLVVSVAGWSPREPFEAQRNYYRELGKRLSGSGVDVFRRQPAEIEVRWKAEAKELHDGAWWMLKSGAGPAEVQEVVDAVQVWPFMTVASGPAELERPLAQMYDRAWVEVRRGGELDVSPHLIDIPRGVGLSAIFYTR